MLLSLVVILFTAAFAFGATRAFAADSVLCSNSNRNACINAGYTDHGYGAHTGTNYWGAPTGTDGHNCTNYVAYVVGTQNGAAISTRGDGKDWDNNAPSGSVDTTPAVGAVAQWEASPAHPTYGHVAYVESVNADGSITVSQDNWSTGPFGWQTVGPSSSNWPNHFIHFKDASVANSSLITPDGVQHVYVAAGTTVQDISWGNGAPLTVWQVASFASPVTSISSQIVSGVHHVYAGTASGSVQDISWGNGAPLTVWQVGSFGSGIKGVSAQIVGGVQHVYTATGKTIQDISWGNGARLIAWQVGSFSSSSTGVDSPVTSISSQLTPDGVQHVYTSTGSVVKDISWGNGAPLTVWQIGSLNASTTNVSSQIINGVHHVYVNTGFTIQDISWGNGAPLTVWQVGAF